MRVEKGYRAFGSDLTSEYNPYEAGIGWAVRPAKANFVGRTALAQARSQPLQRRLCCLTSDDPTAMALGKEPLFAGDRAIGYLTSVDYGYSVGKLIGYAYLPVDYAEAGAQLEAQYFDHRFPMTVSTDPQFDPAMERLKSVL